MQNPRHPVQTAAPTATPDIDAIVKIHRHTDGVITFHKDTGNSFDVVGLRPSALAKLLPEYWDQLHTDGYFSLNAFWFEDAAAEIIHRTMRVRKRTRLRYLCSAFCDLDCYRMNLTAAAAHHEIQQLNRAGMIPPPSGYIFSGRGLWVLWLIGDREHANLPQRAFAEKIQIYDQIQAKLKQILAHLGAEAKDASRVARIPGSSNSKSGDQVRSNLRLTPMVRCLSTRLTLWRSPLERSAIGVRRLGRHQPVECRIDDAGTML